MLPGRVGRFAHKIRRRVGHDAFESGQLHPDLDQGRLGAVEVACGSQADVGDEQHLPGTESPGGAIQLSEPAGSEVEGDATEVGLPAFSSRERRVQLWSWLLHL